MEEQNTNNDEILVPENITDLRAKMDYGIATDEDVLEYSRWREAQRKPEESDESLKQRIETAFNKGKQQSQV